MCIIDFFKFLGVEVIDKRDNGGCLWIVDKRGELKYVMSRLRKKGINFKFAIHGGNSTNNKPAWWTKSSDADMGIWI